MLTLSWFRSVRFALDSLRRGRKQQLAPRRPWLEELEPRLAPATVQFSAASETINEAAGTFSIPVTLTGTQPTVSTFAKFPNPDALAFDTAGNLYVADTTAEIVDKVTPTGVVSTFAKFPNPVALAFDTAGNLYVADTTAEIVDKVTPAGVVSTFAKFPNPVALAFDTAGNLYVADTTAEIVDKVTPAGVVSTFAKFPNPVALAFDTAGNLYVADTTAEIVDKVTPAGVVSTFAKFPNPDALAFDTAGNLYVADTTAEIVDKVTPAGVVSTFAKFPNPVALAFDTAGNLYVADTTAEIVDKVTPAGPVSVPFTLGGTAQSGIDYSGVTASPLVIAAGQTSSTITGTLLSDPGPNQTLTLTLDTPSGASLGSATVNTLTITEPVSPLAARQAVALGLTQSTEYYTDFITNAYNQYLGRAPDAVGLAYWLNLMQNHGLSDERLEAGFIGSTEYISDHGGPGQGWIVGMYQNLLGRTPAPSEVDYWMGQLANNVSTADIAYGFAASQERESDRVTADYEQYLDRGASNSEITYWVNVFLNGGSNEQVIAGFVCSQEYFQDHGNNNVSWLDAAYRSILNRAPDAAGFQYWENQLQ